MSRCEYAHWFTGAQCHGSGTRELLVHLPGFSVPKSFFCCVEHVQVMGETLSTFGVVVVGVS